MDLKIFYFFNNLAGQSYLLDKLAVFFSDYLQYVLVVAFLLFLYFSKYSRREKIIIFLVVMGSAVIARFVITDIIRYFFHRPRPFVLHSVYQLLQKDSYSFPSGHATFFFAMATALYFYSKKLGAWFFVAAFLIGLARVVAGIHYPTDILGGAIVGLLTAWIIFLIVSSFQKRKEVLLLNKHD